MQVLGYGLWARLAAHREYREKKIERIARIEDRKSEEGKKNFSCLHVPLRRSTAVVAAATSNANNRQPPPQLRALSFGANCRYAFSLLRPSSTDRCYT